MAFAPVFRPAFPGTFDRHQPVIAAAGWWVVAGKTTVAAYQPKGAASLAASYVNLANPGTYDAAPGSAPTWAAGTGWTFNGSSQWLTTGVVFTNNQSWSLLFRYSGASATGRAIMLSRTGTGTTDFGAYIDDYTRTYVYNGSYLLVTHASQTGGVWGIAGNKAYLNGSVVTGTIGAGSGTATVALPIGAMDDDGSRSLWYSGNIQAVAIYSDTLTAGEIATVSAAMAAL